MYHEAMNTTDTIIIRATPELRRVLREQAVILEKGDTVHAKAAAEILRANGAVSRCNMGSKEMSEGDDACVAWFAGQFLEIVEENAWFAVNSWLNCVDRFCPEKAP